MAFNSAQALRDAGILGGTMSTELEEFYASLSKEETELLISLRTRLSAILPDVEAHEWTKPEASQGGFDAAMLCMCSIWSGAGDAEAG